MESTGEMPCLDRQNAQFPWDAWRRPLSCAAGTAFRAIAALTCVWAAITACSSAVSAQSLASDWVSGHNVRTRLVAGTIPVGKPGAGTSGTTLAAGLEMELTPGWKTYWRIPGDAGGVPPEFDWKESDNVASIDVRYPAPQRMTDRAGSTIGYKGRVMFPVLITAKDASLPVKLRLMLTFGVCHDICVPSEGTYELTIPPGGAPRSEEIASALARVPHSGATAKEAGKPVPRLTNVEADLAAAEPKVILHIWFPDRAQEADVFVEGPPGEYVPMTVDQGKDAKGDKIFVIELSKGADVAALKGKSLRVTMVSNAGHAETSFVLK